MVPFFRLELVVLLNGEPHIPGHVRRGHNTVPFGHFFKFLRGNLEVDATPLACHAEYLFGNHKAYMVLPLEALSSAGKREA